ncbi:MAG: FtsW/RodA/SpoVE family cell cycle protein [Coriobacteriales bacterium]|jgi:peptidoglycan glycosyltransferase|nr:FtsW/RodA/SpoVE family cell cycle protein [Coriobacteriales bacterium]
MMSRRTTELFLLLAASPVIILLFILAIMNDGRPLDLETLAVPLGLFVAFIISHLALRKLAPNADPAILPIVFALSGIGIAFVMRLAPTLASRQVIWLFVGIAAMLVTLVLVRSVHKLGSYKYLLMLAGIVLLLLPAFIGTTHESGSKIWLSLGGLSFQPGEIAKVLIVLFLAGYLADNREMLSVGGRRVGSFTIPDLRTLAPLLVMWAISMVIVVFERDLGSALLFFGLFLIMVYVATGRKFYVVMGVGLAAVGGVAAFFAFSHVQARIDIWLDPFSYRETSGYQLIQGLYSLADGGLVGTGIGRGMPEFIPVVASDFIFDAIAEEMGLFGASAVLLLFVLFTVRGLTIAARAGSDVDAFAAVGLTTAIALQAFVIVGGVTRFIPLTGVTLPFMSQGGSSLLASFIIVGLLLRVSDSGTGLEKELVGVSTFEGGILGRVTLGKRLTLLVTGFACLFALLIGNLTWHMVITAEATQHDPHNNHTLERNINIQRGAILTSDGVVLAKSEQDANGRWTRVYPEGSLASHIVGYTSATYGSAGVEGTYADVLAGRAGFSSWDSVLDVLTDKDVPGNDTYLTLDSRIQTAAEQALSGEVGGAVVLDAQSGAVLAAASAPTYDNNGVEDLLASTGDDGTGQGGGTTTLFNRATQGLYAPGSTFKTVTLSSALSEGSISLDTSYDSPGTIEIGNAEIRNFDGATYGTIPLLKAFEVSSNTVFAQVADEIGSERLCTTANRFGFNRALDTDFETATSLMPDPTEMTQWETAWAGVGQPVGEQNSRHKSPPGPQTTVLQMAMVGSGIANDGVVMKPHVLEQVVSTQGATVQSSTEQRIDEAISPSVAAKVQEAMAGVVREGTGTAAQIGGYTVHGKTGTAQTNNERDNSWFIGYVEVEGRTVVVAIVIEQAATGTAVPKARGILQAAIDAYGL